MTPCDVMHVVFCYVVLCCAFGAVCLGLLRCGIHVCMYCLYACVVCMFASLSVWLFVCLSVCPFVCNVMCVYVCNVM